MAENSKIEWTDHTFNPWIGCTKISTAATGGGGCDNCYAAAQDKFRRWTPEGWGGPRRRTAPSTWKHPEQWNAESFVKCGACGWRGALTAVGSSGVCPSCKAVDTYVLARRRVFCASLADVFDNQVDPQWRVDLFDLIRRTPNLDWQLLTKRIGNVRSMLQDAAERSVGTGALGLWLAQWHFGSKVPTNVWLGATVVNQEEADRDIPKLLATPARVRFLSMEPLLGPVSLRDWLWECCGRPQITNHGLLGAEEHCCGCPEPSDKIDWVIVGGESGHGARPMHPDWARSLRDQCAAAGVPFLFKQHGEWIGAGGQPNRLPHVWMTLDGKATPYTAGETYHPPWNMPWKHEDPETLAFMAKVGKKAAGRLLDGVEHNGFPA